MVAELDGVDSNKANVLHVILSVCHGLIAVEIMEAQKRSLEKLIKETENRTDDPFNHALQLSRRARNPCARFIDTLAVYNPQEDASSLKHRIITSERTKFITYRTLFNPDLTLYEMYVNPAIPEHQRRVATKVRLSSHNLAIERGRWARKPCEERLCTCGDVQDEAHIASNCPTTEPIRARYPDMNIVLPTIFSNNDVPLIVTILYDLFKPFV
eukprot:GHVO01063438.1.p1 GENE.GHVO01063438.1~~GHVO01063438.1.p1  ORF type:complete len:213 (+),score=13.40 GHVO01063438.1:371-1009(+)